MLGVEDFAKIHPGQDARGSATSLVSSAATLTTAFQE